MKILFFSSAWCASCKPVKNMIKEIQLDTVDFDADSDPEEFKNWNVRSIPTLLLLDNEGKETLRLTGGITKDKIQELKGE